MRGKVMIVAGIPGVGKTTVLDELLKIAGQVDKELTIINYASVMLEIARREGKTLKRDELRHAPIELQRDLQAKAAEEIAKKIANLSTVIIDTHMIISTNDGYWGGLPSNVLEKLRPSLLVLLEADPREILFRRVKNKTRVRDKTLVKEVTDEMAFSRSVAASCSTLTGAPVKILENPAGKQVEVAKRLIEFL